MSDTEIRPSRFHGPAFAKVLQKHGYTRAGGHRGIRGEPGEMWMRGGEVKPTLGGGSARFGADKVHVVDYMRPKFGLPRYSWSHAGGDPMRNSSLTHGATAAELDTHLQQRHGVRTESVEDAARDMLNFGAHEGACVYDMPNGACSRHCAATGQRVSALRRELGEQRADRLILQKLHERKD